jgi:hypothetical protein
MATAAMARADESSATSTRTGSARPPAFSTIQIAVEQRRLGNLTLEPGDDQQAFGERQSGVEFERRHSRRRIELQQAVIV